MDKAFVVGIAGGSASGKSTFSNKLKETLRELKVLEFPMDSYFKPEDARYGKSACDGKSLSR